MSEQWVLTKDDVYTVNIGENEMKTEKGNSFSVLLSNIVKDNTLTMTLNKRPGFEIDAELVEKMVPLISDTVNRGVRPASTYEKVLVQIEHHRDQLVKALEKLVTTYSNQVTPQTRTSSIVKAKMDMLRSMQDKVLKLFASSVGIDPKDYILPDDKEKFVGDVYDAMVKSESQDQD